MYYDALISPPWWARGLAENPIHGTFVGDQSSPEGWPRLLEALSGSRVGRRPSMFSRKPLFGWDSKAKRIREAPFARCGTLRAFA